jgi:hypothetical protein
MPKHCLNIPTHEYKALLRHLIPVSCRSEEAAFVFCNPQLVNGILQFHFLETYLIAPEEFNYRSLYGLEITDDCRAKIIKRAHDLNSSLLELHSHPKASTAKFSPSDRAGFESFVPHVWWRLKKKPYAAIVVGSRNFDSLCWATDAERPNGVLDIKVDDQLFTPTGLTFENWDFAYEF